MMRVVFALLILGVIACALSTAAAAQSPSIIAITHVTVVRVESGARVADQTVIVRGNRIDQVAASQLAVPTGAQQIDGRGAFLIPGLWDMHVHAFRTTDLTRQSNIFSLFVANGITGIRDMGTYLDTLIAIRALLNQGAFPAVPRAVAAGPLLDGPKFQWSQPIAWNLVSVEDGRRAVDSLKRAGVDFIKVYTSLPRDAYFAIASEARKVGLSFAGHIPTSVSATEASNAGQASFEHNGMWVFDGCVDNATNRINAALNRWTSDGLGAWYADRRAYHAARDSTKCARLFSLFRTNSTWMTPTIVLEIKDEQALTRPAFAYLNAGQQKNCQAAIAAAASVPDTLRNGFFSDFLSEVGELSRAGVGILAGTDLPNPCLAAGFSLHDELKELVAAGLTPREALASATINPAMFLHLTDSLGTIAKGKLADLVLLDADPLVDIRNTTRIRAVIANGRAFTREQLDAMLAQAKPH